MGASLLLLAIITGIMGMVLCQKVRRRQQQKSAYKITLTDTWIDVSCDSGINITKCQKQKDLLDGKIYRHRDANLKVMKVKNLIDNGKERNTKADRENGVVTMPHGAMAKENKNLDMGNGPIFMGNHTHVPESNAIQSTNSIQKENGYVANGHVAMATTDESMVNRNESSPTYQSSGCNEQLSIDMAGLELQKEGLDGNITTESSVPLIS